MGVGSRERLRGMRGWTRVPVGARGVRISITGLRSWPFSSWPGRSPAPQGLGAFAVCNPWVTTVYPDTWLSMRVLRWCFPFQFEGSFHLIYIFSQFLKKIFIQLVYLDQVLHKFHRLHFIINSHKPLLNFTTILFLTANFFLLLKKTDLSSCRIPT